MILDRDLFTPPPAPPLKGRGENAKNGSHVGAKPPHVTHFWRKSPLPAGKGGQGGMSEPPRLKRPSSKAWGGGNLGAGPNQ